MALLAGWVETNLSVEESKHLLAETVAQAPVYTQQNVKIDDHANFCVFATAQQNIYRDKGVCLINVGSGELKVSAEQLIDQYLRVGDDFLKHVKLEQALLLIDAEAKKILLVTDPVGLTHFYYAQIDKGLVFGHSADSVIAHPQVADDILPQSIYDYVYFHHCPSPHSIYQQVKKLEGGQILSFQAGNIRVEHYWLPEFHEKLSSGKQALAEDLRQKLIDSVADMSVGADQTAAFLSGGLDSSSVAGALARVYPEQAQTFSIGFHVEGYDETAFANIAVEHFKTRQHAYYLSPEDTVKAIPEIAAYYDEPFGNSSALAAYYCAKVAKQHGVTVILGGDGGDELFAGNERYAQQMVFDYYHKAPGFIGSGLDALLNHLPEPIAKQKLFHKAKRYIAQAKVPLPDRLQDYNFLHRHAASDIFQDDYLSAINQHDPLELLRASYHRPKQASSLNRMLYMDWKTTLHDNDLVKVNKMCEMAGLEVRYPLLSREIVELSCAIPSAEKLQIKALRKFYKEAMVGFLPDAILNKSKHGFGLPFGIWLKDYQPLQDLAYDSINDLKKRSYFKNEFLDHAVKMHQSIHAAYYGELIWILMMLELWFQGKKR